VWENSVLLQRIEPRVRRWSIIEDSARAAHHRLAGQPVCKSESRRKVRARRIVFPRIKEGSRWICVRRAKLVVAHTATQHEFWCYLPTVLSIPAPEDGVIANPNPRHLLHSRVASRVGPVLRGEIRGDARKGVLGENGRCLQINIFLPRCSHLE